MSATQPWTVDERKFFEPAEQATLRSHVRQAKRRTQRRGPWLDWLLVELAFLTGLRVSELAALRCGDLCTKGQRPGVVVRRGKGGKWRYVRINRHCCRVIETFRSWRQSVGESVDPEGPVFRAPGGEQPMTVRALQKRFARLLGVTGIQGHSLHHCRHTYATGLYLASGGDLRLVQKQLGHAKITTTQVYADVFDETMQAAIEQLYRPSHRRRQPSKNGAGRPVGPVQRRAPRNGATPLPAPHSIDDPPAGVDAAAPSVRSPSMPPARSNSSHGS